MQEMIAIKRYILLLLLYHHFLYLFIRITVNVYISLNKVTVNRIQHIQKLPYSNAFLGMQLLSICPVLRNDSYSLLSLAYK